MCRYVIIQRQINLAGERRDSGSWLQNLTIFVYFILDTEVDIFGEIKEERFLKPLASRSLTNVMFSAFALQEFFWLTRSKMWILLPWESPLDDRRWDRTHEDKRSERAALNHDLSFELVACYEKWKITNDEITKDGIKALWLNLILILLSCIDL